MSRRNLRKLFPETATMPPEESDDEVESLSTSGNKYNGLLVSSSGESDYESPSALNSESENKDETKKKKTHKKRRSKKSSEIQDNTELDQPVAEIEQSTTTSSHINSESEDTVKQIKKNKKKKNKKKGVEYEEGYQLVGSRLSLQEVYDIHRTQITEAQEESVSVPVPQFMLVEQKNLNAENEHIRRFGPIANDQGVGNRTEKHSRQAAINRLLNRRAIVPIAQYAPIFKKNGLTMSIERREKGYTYFTFDHDKDYQWMHRNFLILHKTHSSVGLHFEEAQNNLHVEGLLEFADLLFDTENNVFALTLVEKAIAFMQYVAHPKFILTDPSTRLEYKYRENRPFHVALLKYVYILTNRACHRTALEMAKVLLNLDPSDPLAVLLVIDMLALRARQHEWLVEAVSHWNQERHAGFLFNVQYSLAMAQFHISVKSGDVSKADQLLQKAMIRFPSIVMKILEYTGVRNEDYLKNHPLYTNNECSQKLKGLINFYAKFTWTKWREPAVMEWFIRNAKELANKYDNEAETKKLAQDLSNQRMNLFQWWPYEVNRHLCVIRHLSQLVVDGAVPEVTCGLASDPLPTMTAIDRYYRPAPTPTETNPRLSFLNLLTAFFGMDTAGPT